MPKDTKSSIRLGTRASIPLLLSKSPHFACICLFYCLIYIVSFVFRASWHQNLCLYDSLAIAPVSKSDQPIPDHPHSLLSLSLSQFPIKCQAFPARYQSSFPPPLSYVLFRHRWILVLTSNRNTTIFCNTCCRRYHPPLPNHIRNRKPDVLLYSFSAVLIQALEAVAITSRIGAARRCSSPLSVACVFAATVLHIQLDSVHLIADSSIFTPFVNLLQAFLLVPLHIHKVYIFSKDYLHLISLGDLKVKLALHVITVYRYCAPFRPFQTLLENEF